MRETWDCQRRYVRCLTIVAKFATSQSVRDTTHSPWVSALWAEEPGTRPICLAIKSTMAAV
ncbi:hypothetical protein ACVXG9_00850 [Escherichia coli]